MDVKQLSRRVVRALVSSFILEGLAFMLSFIGYCRAPVYLSTIAWALVLYALVLVVAGTNPTDYSGSRGVSGHGSPRSTPRKGK